MPDRSIVVDVKPNGALVWDGEAVADAADLEGRLDKMPGDLTPVFSLRRVDDVNYSRLYERLIPIPAHGFEVEFEAETACAHDRSKPEGRAVGTVDFLGLIAQPEGRTVVAPLFKAWFGYAILASPDVVRVVNDQGRDVPPGELYWAIQCDAARQQSLYQTAMTLWR